MRILGVDYGDSRTGVAVSDISGFLASGVETIFEKKSDKVASRVAELASELGAEEIVLGMPKNMDGTIGARGEKTQRLVEKIKKVTDIPVSTWDERLTTVSAEITLNEVNIRGKKRKNVIDTIAAEIILQSYLDYKKRQQG